ncbi:Protein of unknown function, partial [Gryllus bimaculatus]
TAPVRLRRFPLPLRARSAKVTPKAEYPTASTRTTWRIKTTKRVALTAFGDLDSLSGFLSWLTGIRTNGSGEGWVGAAIASRCSDFGGPCVIIPSPRRRERAFTRVDFTARMNHTPRRAAPRPTFLQRHAAAWM